MCVYSKRFWYCYCVGAAILLLLLYSLLHLAENIFVFTFLRLTTSFFFVVRFFCFLAFLKIYFYNFNDFNKYYRSSMHVFFTLLLLHCVLFFFAGTTYLTTLTTTPAKCTLLRLATPSASVVGNYISAK